MNFRRVNCITHIVSFSVFNAGNKTFGFVKRSTNYLYDIDIFHFVVPDHFPEKLIPLMIINALADKNLPVYGEGLNVRDWLYVKDHCKAIDLIIHKGRVGEVYNIGGHNEMKRLIFRGNDRDRSYWNNEKSLQASRMF